MNLTEWPKPPRILLAMGGFASIGGIEVFAQDLAEFLIRSGAAVSLAYWPIRGHSPILKVMERGGCGLICGPVTRGVRWDLPDRAMFMRVFPSLKEFDLIIFLKLFSDPVMHAFLRRLQPREGPKVPSLYIPSFCPEEDESYKDRPKPQPAIINRIDSIMTQCPKMAGQIESYLEYEGRIHTIPLLSSVRDAEAIPLPEIVGSRPKIQVSYIGRLTAQKNVASLLDSYAFYLEELEAKLPFTIDLHVYGDGAEQSRLQGHGCVSANPDRVRFHGAYRHSELKKIASKTSFFVQTTRFEGQCLAALEVMALGRPLIAMNAGCLDDVIREMMLGRVIPQGDQRGFAEAMAQLGFAALQKEIEPLLITNYFKRRFSRETLEPLYLELITSLIQAGGAAKA